MVLKPIMTNNLLPLLKLVDKTLAKEVAQEKPRTYIGGSSIGIECERRIQYSKTHPHLREIIEPRVKRIFQVGDMYEEYMESLLKRCGFDIRGEKEDGSQYAFSMADGRFQGHVDGVLMNGPKFMEFPALPEFKSANDKRFKEFVKLGLQSTNAVYYAQVQIYQLCTGLTNPALWMVMNKNDQEIYAELVPHHAAFAESLVEKLQRILDAIDGGTLLPREYNTKTHRKCKYCDFKEECWKQEEETAPSWAP